ncbi:hypothetical protein CK203_060357 [Vitis vinifera]|uniref:SWIM-type domain-containing protein n=1 Tax=Vitis vinifera TaxID=29760 RepID=A0A438FSD7_VITVI|nr:hypothetical protein CK203_060357 [Vitis vinifera]
MATFMKEGRLYLRRINKYNTRVDNKKACTLDKGCSYAEFVSKACERLDINSNGYTFHYTLEFDPSALQQLDDDEDMHMMLSHSYDYARIYVLKRTRRVEVEGSHNSTEETHNSVASCQANNESNLGLSQAFMSRCAETEVMPHDLNVECSSQPSMRGRRGARVIEQVIRGNPSVFAPSNLQRLQESRLVDINPGTIAEYSTQDGHFWQLGSLFSATAYDADDGMFPIAFGVEERHYTIFNLVMTHMDKFAHLACDHMGSTENWKAAIGPKTEEKLSENIIKSGSLPVYPYVGGVFKVFNMKVYVDVNLRERTCTCKAWQMAGIPCEHACATIRQMKQDVYEYVDSYFKLPMQELIYSRHFNSIPNHNMPIVDADGCVRSLISFA